MPRHVKNDVGVVTTPRNSKRDDDVRVIEIFLWTEKKLCIISHAFDKNSLKTLIKL